MLCSGYKKYLHRKFQALQTAYRAPQARESAALSELLNVAMLHKEAAQAGKCFTAVQHCGGPLFLGPWWFVLVLTSLGTPTKLL